MQHTKFRPSIVNGLGIKTKPAPDLKNEHIGQFQYLDRWVNKEHFCAFVYDDHGNQQLAKNYAEYESLTASGLWFASKPELHSRKRKLNNDISSPDGK